MPSVKLIGRGYSYAPDGGVRISATVQLLAADGVTVLYSAAISTSAHLLSATWKDDMKASLLAQIARVQVDYEGAMMVAQMTYPGKTSPQEILNVFADEVEAAANGGA